MSDDLDNFRGSRYIKLLDPFNSSLDCVSISIPFPQGGGGSDDLRKVFEGKCVCMCYEKVVTQGWRDKLGLEGNEAPARMLDAGLFSRFVVENRGETWFYVLATVVVANNVIFGRFVPPRGESSSGTKFR